MGMFDDVIVTKNNELGLPIGNYQVHKVLKVNGNKISFDNGACCDITKVQPFFGKIPILKQGNK